MANLKEEGQTSAVLQIYKFNKQFLQLQFVLGNIKMRDTVLAIERFTCKLGVHVCNRVALRVKC